MYVHMYVLAMYAIAALTLFVIAVSTTNNVCTYDTHGWNRNHFKLWSYVYTQSNANNNVTGHGNYYSDGRQWQTNHIAITGLINRKTF